ncbi:hypothetical protein MSPP1_001350 [Malassezia sp. CBS 17886]|nr:hypothetical protein MSPP1_001350 [Malassezia sp. CBS 17886]
MPTFTRYLQPFIPPTEESSAWPSSLGPLVAALEHHDVDACWAALTSLPPSTRAVLPYVVWRAAWTLVAEGPAVAPMSDLYGRLDAVCERLCTLHALFAQLFPSRGMPIDYHRRLIYLLLKRAERIDAELARSGADTVARAAARARHAEALHDVISRGCGATTEPLTALDTELLGRVVFRLARLRALTHVAPLANAYARRSDGPAGDAARVQPFVALVVASIQEMKRADEGAPLPDAEADGERRSRALLLGLDSVRMAFSLALPLRSTLVHDLLLCGGRSLVYVLARETAEAAAIPHAAAQGPAGKWCTAAAAGASPDGAPDQAAVRGAQPEPHALPLADRDRSLVSRGDVRAAVRRLVRVRAAYFLYRAAVLLCRLGDAELALHLVRTQPSCVPFDVYAAAVCALTWRVRRDTDHAVETLVDALQVVHTMQSDEHGAGYDVDEQMLAELVRAFSAALTRAPRGKARELAPHLRAFTAVALRRMAAAGDSALGLRSHARLLAMNLSARSYVASRRLFEQARRHFPDVALWGDAFPQVPTSGMSWLLREACRRPGQLPFATRLYHDWRATTVMPFSTDAILTMLRALLAHHHTAAAHRVVLDIRAMTDTVPRGTLSGTVAAFFAWGDWESAISVARVLCVRSMAPQPWQAQVQPGATPPLYMYAVLFREAAQLPVLALDPAPRAGLTALFDEFRLVLAHALADGVPTAEDGQDIAAAYHGMAQTYVNAIPAVGAQRAATLAAARELLMEVEGVCAGVPQVEEETAQLRARVERCGATGGEEAGEQ